MITNEKIENLYSKVVSGEELTTKLLNNCGFNSKDINNLLDKNLISRIKRGYYDLVSLESLYEYAKKLIEKGDYVQAGICLDKCYEINPGDLNIQFYQLYTSIKTNNYKKIFYYFDDIYFGDVDTLEYNDVARNNLILYLLNYITDVPEKYKELSKKINYKKVKLKKDTNEKDIITEINRIYYVACQRLFAPALFNFSNFFETNEKSNYDLIIGALLQKADVVQRKNKTKFYTMIEDKNIDGIIAFLERLKGKILLRKSELISLSIAYSIKNMNSTGELPLIDYSETNSLITALDNHNYPLARTLCEEYNKSKGLDVNKSYVYLLSSIANEVVGELYEKQGSQKSSAQQCNIIGDLKNNDIANAINKIDIYLNNMGMSSYKFIILGLIRISILEKDSSFEKVTRVLNNMESKTYNADINEFIRLFYLALSNNNFDVASTYLDIIKRFEIIGIECKFVDLLNTLLSKTQHLFNTSKLSNQKINSETNFSIENVKKEISSTSTISETQGEIQTNQSDIKIVEILNEKIEYLENNSGIVIFDSINVDDRNVIEDIISKRDDFKIFDIEFDVQKQLVLYYCPMIGVYSKEDFKQIIEDANQFYIDKKFEDAIEQYIILLESDVANTHTYAKIGLSFLHIKEIDKAIPYLKVATYLSKVNDGRYDFTDLINNLTEKKPTSSNTRLKSTEFVFDKKSDIDKYYGITNIEQIADLINNGMNVFEACKEVGLDENKTIIAIILIARECYIIGNYTLGDQYLKIAEYSHNKNDYARHLLSEVRSRKKFYKYGDLNNHKKLVLKPIINKKNGD